MRLTLSESPMSLQGPHHCAWKSTSTGTSLPRTISSKLVNCCVFAASTVSVAERPTVAVPLQSAVISNSVTPQAVGTPC